MGTRSAAWALVASSLFLLAPQVSWAQFDAAGQPGAISGTGTTVIKQKPDFMRMQLQLSATGKTLKEALARLEERRAAALKQLEALGAAKASIILDGPKPSTVSPEQQQMMEMMARQRQRGARRSSAAKAQPATISYNVTADWPLEGKTTEELLVEADALQTKIKTANIAQVGDEELSPEEQELAEEMQEMTQSYGGRQMPKPGTPSFVFGKKLERDTLAAATTEAFGKAKQNAERLSEAAGVKLGPLRQLTSQAQIVNSQDPYSRMSGMYPYYGTQSESEEGELTQAIGSDAGEVQVTVRVFASFSLSD